MLKKFDKRKPNHILNYISKKINSLEHLFKLIIFTWTIILGTFLALKHHRYHAIKFY